MQRDLARIQKEMIEDSANKVKLIQETIPKLVFSESTSEGLEEGMMLV